MSKAPKSNQPPEKLSMKEEEKAHKHGLEKYFGGSPKVMYRAQEQQRHQLRVAEAIVFAILQNPKVDQFCYGSPLDPHSCGGHPNVGEYLAHVSYRLADQLCTAFDRIADPVPAPTAETPPTAVVAGALQGAGMDAGLSELFIVKDDQGDQGDPAR